MDKILRKLPVAIAMVLMSQSFLFMQPVVANTAPVLSRTDFSETTRNTDLSNKIQVFPSPIYSANPATGEVTPNQYGEGGGYPLYQAFVSESSPAKNFSAEQKLDVGIGDSKQNIALLKFGNALPDLGGGLIYNAELDMFEIDKPVKWGYWDPAYIDQSYSIHKVLDGWVGDSISWEDRPQISVPYANNTLSIGKDGGHFKWDVTKMVAEWYKDPKTDFGLAVKGKEGMPDSLRSFYTSKGYSNKSYSQMDKAPRLFINYSQRPSFYSGYGKGSDNTGAAYVDLQWHPQKGVKGYKLSIFNGKEYETIDIGMTHQWKSYGKNLWPSEEEIINGAYELKLDGSGTNLFSDPGRLYENAGNTEKDPDRYYFRLTAYNEFGESAPSEELSVLIPTQTAPDKVANVIVTEASPTGVKVEWDSLQNAEKYRVRVGTTPEGGDLASGAETTINEISITSHILSPGQTIYVSVEAMDKEGNYSGYTVPIPVVVKNKNDVQHASMFSSSSVDGNSVMTIDVKNDGSESWTLEKGYELKLVSGNALLAADLLSAEEEIKPGETKNFQIRFTGKQLLGTVPLQWQMHQASGGFFGMKIFGNVTFYDAIKPEVTIQSPNPSALLYETVEVKGTVKDFTLKEYQLFYGSGSAPLTWNLISSGTEPVDNGLLGSWGTSGLAPGNYTLKLEAIDEAGNTSTQMREVKVNLPLGELDVKKVTDQSEAVTGGAYQNGLTVSIQKGDQVLGSDVIDTAGLFSVPIGKQPAGTVLTLFVKNEFGVIVKEMQITVMDGTPPSAPKVNAVADNSIQVSGTAEKGAAVTILKGTTTIGTTDKISLDGTFAINIAKQTAGSELQVVVKDAAGNLSAPTIVNVIDKTPPPAPAVNTIADNSAFVSGKAEKGSTVTIKSVNAIDKSTRADSTGAYSVAIPKQKAGTAITVSAKDAAGNISTAAIKKVLDKTPPSAPLVPAIADYSTSIKGNAEKDSIVTAKRGSTVLGWAKANSYGVYVVKIAKQNAGTIISLAAKDAAGNIGTATAKKVVDKTAPSLPLIYQVYSSSKSVSGKAEPYATVIVKKGSTVLGTTKATSKGTYMVTIKPQARRTVLNVVAKDAAGNNSKAASLAVK